MRSSSSSEPLKFRLCDTRGLEETQGIDANDVTYLLDGNVPDGYHVSWFSSLCKCWIIMSLPVWDAKKVKTTALHSSATFYQ